MGLYAGIACKGNIEPAWLEHVSPHRLLVQVCCGDGGASWGGTNSSVQTLRSPFLVKDGIKSTELHGFLIDVTLQQAVGWLPVTSEGAVLCWMLTWVVMRAQ